MSKRRTGPIARGLLIVALLALALLPLAGLPPGPRRVEAQTSSQDSLWAGQYKYISACASPWSSAALSGCFSAPTDLGKSGGTISTMAADGVNVYFATDLAGGYSCPIAELGANCTPIMTGPWNGATVTSLATAGGVLWIGQDNGEIYRCAANIPYAKGKNAPSGCTLLDDAGPRAVESLLLANGRLYAGLSSYGITSGKQGILWSCDPDTVNACENLDYYGSGNWATSMTAGGGYLWAALYNGILWRCDLNAANACANWDTAGNTVYSVSYGGADNVYAAVGGKNGAIWWCPTAAANRCSTLISGVDGYGVAAGAGGVFSSAKNRMSFDTSAFSAVSSNLNEAYILYVPAGGVTGVGGVSVNVQGGKWTEKLGKRCAKGGKGLKGSVQVTGPGGHDKTVAVNLCALAKGGSVKEMFDLLDPGIYTVKAETTKWKKQFSGSVTFTVETDTTVKVQVRLARARN
ncbi:MAG: hypothetical protein ACKOWF_09870 [Chloroflexota bacterium]